MLDPTALVGLLIALPATLISLRRLFLATNLREQMRVRLLIQKSGESMRGEKALKPWHGLSPVSAQFCLADQSKKVPFWQVKLVTRCCILSSLFDSFEEALRSVEEKESQAYAMHCDRWLIRSRRRWSWTLLPGPIPPLLFDAQANLSCFRTQSSMNCGCIQQKQKMHIFCTVVVRLDQTRIVQIYIH